MKKTIRHQFFYEHPVAAVWDYLTKAELISQWLMPTNFELRVGHDFQFTTKPIPSLDLDGVMYCKVLEIEPQKRLSYSWKAGPGDGVITLDTIVVWTLKTTADGTEVHLEHSGFKEIENFNIYTGMTEGWQKHMQKIADRLKMATHDADKS